MTIPVEVLLSYLEALTEAEEESERDIILVRKYYGGDQGVELTDRLKEFLGSTAPGGSEFRFNLLKSIIAAITERLIVKGIDCADTDQAAIVWQWWTLNHFDVIQEDVYEGALRDGEYFVIVDWDVENNIPMMTAHQRWTDTMVGGDGYGCRVIYPDNDYNQDPLVAVKQWIDNTNLSDPKERRTLYFPDHIERQVRNQQGKWVPFSEPENPSFVDWTLDGKPMGIPVIHFKNKGLLSEIWEALPMQDATNKSVVDLLSTSDMTAFRIYYALGFIPTEDGLEPEEDGSNWLKIEPGRVVGTTRPKSEVDFGAIEPADLKATQESCHQFMLWMAMVTGTPTARFVTTGQIARKETLKEQENPLIAKVRSRQTRFGNSWEDVMYMARKLYNKFAVGESALAIEPMYETLWADPETRNEMERVQMLVLKRELGIPLEQLWAEAGYTRQQIELMKTTEEYRRMIETLGPEPGSSSKNETKPTDQGDNSDVTEPEE